MKQALACCYMGVDRPVFPSILGWQHGEGCCQSETAYRHIEAPARKIVTYGAVFVDSKTPRNVWGRLLFPMDILNSRRKSQGSSSDPFIFSGFIRGNDNCVLRERTKGRDPHGGMALAYYSMKTDL